MKSRDNWKRCRLRAVACEAIRNNSAMILCPSMDAAVEASNQLAPEHLAIYDAGLLPKIQHAGSVFIGPSSPEAAGDYATGPNHVLPTSARRGFAAVFRRPIS